MDRHTDVFFSDEDVARFAKGRVFLGEPPPDDGASKLSLAPPIQNIPLASEPMHILPTANHCRRVREREEREELRRSREGGESCVTVDSLPFVYEESGNRDRAGCLDKNLSVQKKRSTTFTDTNRNEKKRIVVHECREHAHESGGSSTSGGGLSDVLIATSDEDYERDQEGMFISSRKKQLKSSLTNQIKQISPCESQDGSVSCLNNKSDSGTNSATKKSCIHKNNSYDLYSERSEVEEDGESSEGGISDELVTFEDGGDDENNLEEIGASDRKLKTSKSRGSSIRKNNSHDLYSEAEDDGMESSEGEIGDESIPLDDDDAGDDGECNNKGNGDNNRKLKISKTEESCINEKNSYDLYSEADDEREASSEGVSDELISSADDDGSDGKNDSGGDQDSNEKPKTSNTASAPVSKTLTTSSEAIGSSIVKSIPDDSGWHRRRSESEVVLSRIKHNKQRSLLRRRRKTAGDDAARRRTGGEAAQQPSRTTLRFAAAPGAANKRKKQMSLKDMFKKT